MTVKSKKKVSMVSPVRPSAGGPAAAAGRQAQDHGGGHRQCKQSLFHFPFSLSAKSAGVPFKRGPRIAFRFAHRPSGAASSPQGSPGGDDLDPVPVRVRDEVDAHGGVLKADAAHGRMLGVGGVVVLRPQGQVELALPQVVFLRMVPQPGELQAEVRLAVPQVDDDEAAVGRRLPLPTGSRPRASL